MKVSRGYLQHDQNTHARVGIILISLYRRQALSESGYAMSIRSALCRSEC